MKRLVKKAIKKPLRWAWDRLGPRREHFKYDTHMFLHRTVVLPIVNGMEFPDRISNLDRRLDAITQRMELIQHELNLTLNDLVREVVRLQNQLEDIRAEQMYIRSSGSLEDDPLAQTHPHRKAS